MRSRLSGVYLEVGKLVDNTFDLKRIFFDISLVRKFEETIFRLALRFFDSIFRLPWRIVVEISFNYCANTSKYRSKVRRYFEENKARNSSKFALITFAQYCNSAILGLLSVGYFTTNEIRQLFHRTFMQDIVTMFKDL